jgi:diaminohydroxyphosphoribosylaminopyrimidine deaminase/5-amino-6-(5-phosphoribosylamino)uracil reductase
MTLDGKIATYRGSSQWISGEASRARVHQLRGRVDGILVGARTAAVDDPMLTARPPGPRLALRIVVDRSASLRVDSRLVRTAREIPVLVAVGPETPEENCRRLVDAGCEVWRGASSSHLLSLLDELGRRRMTNVLVEGGGRLLGSLFDARAIDEVHVFLGSKLVGGADAPSPLAGTGVERLTEALPLIDPQFERLGDDFYLYGRLGR